MAVTCLVSRDTLGVGGVRGDEPRGCCFSGCLQEGAIPSPLGAPVSTGENPQRGGGRVSLAAFTPHGDDTSLLSVHTPLMPASCQGQAVSPSVRARLPGRADVLGPTVQGVGSEETMSHLCEVLTSSSVFPRVPPCLLQGPSAVAPDKPPSPHALASRETKEPEQKPDRPAHHDLPIAETHSAPQTDRQTRARPRPASPP